jgi:uncharacterized RDD family membrane protein YckC
MLCPKCQSGEIADSDLCPICGFQMQADADASLVEFKRKKGRNADCAGMIEMDYSGQSEEVSPEPKDMPEWRQEVSRRLQEIKQKRQTLPNTDFSAPVPSPLPFPEPEKTPIQSQAPPPEKNVQAKEELRPPVRIQPEIKARAASVPTAANIQGIRNKVAQEESRRALPLFRAPKPKSSSPSPKRNYFDLSTQPSADSNPAAIQKLIDSVVVKQAAPQAAQPLPIFAGDRRAMPLDRYENKLVLLSRAFSGMVDLLIIVLCAGTFVFVADAISGIVVVDTISWMDYCLLFLATHFTYSLFFLGTTNQTIGMMITDLRVVGTADKRTLLRQILGRSSSFLISLLAFGMGLLWGIFDRESQCLHDRLSGTHIIRI